MNGITINSLVWDLNIKQREEFKALIIKFKSEGLDEVFSKTFNDYSCDKIVEDIDSTTEYEKKQKIKESAAEKGESSIPKEKWGVHEHHCCIHHGCKYGHIDCPVSLDLIVQIYPCETCSDEENENLKFKK